MRHEVNPIATSTAFVANPTGCTRIIVDRFREKTVQVGTTAFTAACNLQGSLDGTEWSNLQVGITAGAIYSVAFAVKYLRIAVTADGTRPTVLFAGFDSRSE